MSKLYTPTKKDDILAIIVEKFEKANEDYTAALKSGDPFTDRKFGAYNALIDILSEIKVYGREGR